MAKAGSDGGHEVIGWVGGDPVEAGDLRRYLDELALVPAGARLGIVAGAIPSAPSDDGPSRDRAINTWATKTLLVERLLAAEAAGLGVAPPGSPEEWVDLLVAAGEIHLRPPTPAEARACYRANPHRYRVPEARRVRHVLVSDRRSAEELLACTSVRALAEQAREISLDPGSRALGGDLGWVERGQLTGELEDCIFGAVPGEVTGPVHSAFGWHVLVVEAVRRARVRPFAECEPEIAAELNQDRRRAAWEEWRGRRLGEAIRVPAGAEHPLFPGLPGTTHRH